MSAILTVFIVSRYSEERLNDFLADANPKSWMQNRCKDLRKAIGQNPDAICTVAISSEQKLICQLNQQNVPDEKVAIEVMRKWTEIIVPKIGHFPLLFYITYGNKSQVLDTNQIDSAIYQLGGPLFLIDEELWNSHSYLRQEFKSTCLYPFFKEGQCAVVREPEIAWMTQFEENLGRLINRPTRHALEYLTKEEDNLPQDIKKERKQLDNVINLPLPGQRISMEPTKNIINILQEEHAEDVSRRAYQDVPIGRKKDNGKTVGGRSLLIACNKDVNLISGWRDGDNSFEIHNANSLHFYPSVRVGSLPEAMNNSRVILKNAWIEGSYQSPDLPKMNRRPKRMIWPQYHLSKKNDSSQKDK